MSDLSEKQERFAIAVAGGEKGVDAYSKIFPKATRKSATEKASQWSRKDNIKSRIEELQQKKRAIEAQCYAQATTEMVQEFKGQLLTPFRRRQLLQARAEKPLVSDTSLVAILIADARLAGDLIDKQELTGQDGTPLPSALPTIIFTERTHCGRRRQNA